MWGSKFCWFNRNFSFKFNFKKLVDTKPGAYFVEFTQATIPSNKDRLTYQNVIFASIACEKYM